ncbi:MAG TPA: putative zinc-binding metallopeptidase [Verrucomicrobiae bacterium]|nr:putative zinc-binding metallopeptidase [Verrucomicrobiae bacterium]
MTGLSWNNLRENALLEKKITELDLTISRTAIATLIQKLYRELQDKGLSFLPPCFLADEWFCPVGVPAIGIPFYLAHPRLRRLEKKMMLEAEGDSKTEFLKLIRHEAGHAYSYAYNLYKKSRWRELFGPASKEYPDTYRPRPHSRSYVIHLENWYAQSHPDEDFAETFAVWLTPNLNWKQRYRGWKGALEKLEYVDHLMKSIAGKTPVNKPRFHPRDYSGLNLKLKTFYKRKKKLFAEDYPDFYDKDLRTLFTDSPEHRGEKKAAAYLRENRGRIADVVSFWTKEKKYTVDNLLQSLIPRCQELNLYVKKGDTVSDSHIASYVTTLVTNHLFTGKFKRSK